MSILRNSGMDGAPIDQPESDLASRCEYTLEELASAAFDFARAEDLGFDISDPDVRRTVFAASARKRQERAEREAQRIDDAKAGKGETESVVYYMRVGDRVKIGFSTNLTGRIAALAPEEVLAVEPGGRLLEGVRHRQFADLRVTREWFRMEEPLVSHMDRLQQAAA